MKIMQIEVQIYLDTILTSRQYSCEDWLVSSKQEGVHFQMTCCRFPTLASPEDGSWFEPSYQGVPLLTLFPTSPWWRALLPLSTDRNKGVFDSVTKI